MRFSSLFSSGFITAIVVNPPERKLANRTSVHCTEIDFAMSFGAVLVKMIDLSKTESRDFFGIILGQENSQKLHLLPDARN